jgi:hypothetical protein
VDLKDKIQNIKAWMLRNRVLISAAIEGIQISDTKL